METTEGFSEKGKQTPVGKMIREKDLKEYKKSPGPNIQGLAEGGDVAPAQDQQPAPAAAPVNVHVYNTPSQPPPAANPAVVYGNQQPQINPPAVSQGVPNVDPNTGQMNPAAVALNAQAAARGQKRY
jgi:hypothetical protein